MISLRVFTRLLAVFSALALFVAMLLWAGLPRQGSLPLFIAGAATLLVILTGFAVLTWHLLLRRLPPGHKQPRPRALPAATRQMLAVLVALSGINIVVGGFWDEVWHRQYGSPFGEDLFWRPHLLLYLGFLLVSALAFASLIRLLRRGRGTLQQRFRADPITGLLVVMGGFLIYALPADPLWHLIYGEDITAWSLPHLVLFLSFTLIILLSSAIYLSTRTARAWTEPPDFANFDGFLLIVFSFALVVALQVLATEWDATNAFAISLRPTWLLPAIIAAVAAFIGTLVLGATRQAGMATAVGITAFFIRFSLIRLFGFTEMSADPWLVTLPPLFLLDIWYGWRIWQGKRPDIVLFAGLSVAVGTALFSLPLIDRLFLSPDISMAGLPAMLLAIAGAALAGSWLGTALGDYLALANKQVEPKAARSHLQRFLAPVSLGLVVTFMLIFIFTASPPV